MFCKNCGEQIIEGAKFCRKCGTSINQDIIGKALVEKNSKNNRQSKSFEKNMLISIGTKVAVGVSVVAVVIGGLDIISKVTGDTDSQVEEVLDENTEEENNETERSPEVIEEGQEESSIDTTLLENGWYYVDMYSLGNGRTIIEEGVLIVEAGEWIGPSEDLFDYDNNKKIDVGDSVRIAISDNCYIHSQQGEPDFPGSYIDMSIEDYNMYGTVYELARYIKIEDGLITEIFMTS